jgi:hypothetical protein
MLRFIINLTILGVPFLLTKINSILAITVMFVYYLCFIVLGILFLNLKGVTAFSIMYNKPKNILEKYYYKNDLFRFEGWVLIILSFGLLAMITGAYFELFWVGYIGIAYCILIGICSIIYSKNGKRFRV